MSAWNKPSFILTALAALFFFTSPAAAWSTPIDPDDPKFDPTVFRLENYPPHEDKDMLLPAALMKMFPPGTEKAYIDKILISQAGMKSAKAKSGNYYEYLKASADLSGWDAYIEYDKKNRSSSFYLGIVRLYGKNAYLEERDTQRWLPSKVQNKLDAIENKMKPLRYKYLGSGEGLVEDRTAP
jgi:hypothetical protein